VENRADDETYQIPAVEHEWEFWIDLPEFMTPEQEWQETVEALLEMTR